MDDVRPVPIETLLAERDWVRWLARTLVADAQSADDLEQQTWLAAIERPPSSGGSVRGWLATVLRRAASKGRRSAERGGRRERAAARPEGGRSTVDIVAEAELHDRVVRAVLALEEPYRTTILLRFFENLPPRDVAERMGVPVETARSRVQRGVALLREQFDREHGGDRKAWIAAFVPLTAPSSDAGPAPAPAAPAAPDVPHAAAALPVKALALGVAVVLAVGGAVRWYVGTTDERPDGGPTAPATLVADGAAASEPALAAPPGGRGGAPRAPADSAHRAPAGTAALVGTVRRDGPDGAPVADARVVAIRRGIERETPDTYEATSGADGRYAFTALPAGETMVFAEAPGLTTRGLADVSLDGFNPLATTVTSAGATTLDLLLVAGAVASGRVIDADGKPMSGATIWAVLPATGMISRFDRRLELPPWTTRSKEDGTFRFESLPSDVTYDFEAFVDGFRPGHREGVSVPGADAESIELRIPASRWIDIQVVEGATGAPVVGAEVYASELPVERVRSRRLVPYPFPVTGPDGRVRMGPFRVLDVEVQVAVDAHTTKPVATIRQRLPKDEASVVIRIDRTIEPSMQDRLYAFLDEKGMKVHVVGPDGSPVPSARAAMYRWVTNNGGGGGLSIGAVHDGFANCGHSEPPAEYVEVYAARGADGAPLPFGAARVALAKDVREVTIRLEPERSIQGIVVGPDGVGLAGALVVAQPDWVPVDPSPLAGIVHATARSGHRGTFRLGGLADTRYRLVARLPKHLALDVPLVVAAGSMDVVLTARASIRPTLTILDSTGKPVPGARVALLPPGSDPRQAEWILASADMPEGATTDSLGAAVLGPVDPAARYLLTIDPPPSRPDLKAEARDGWAPHDETLTLGVERVLRGRVHDAAGKPVEGVEILWTTARGGGRSVPAAADGTFVLRGVPMTALTLVPHFREQSVRATSPQATVVPADAEEADVTFDPGLALVVHVEGGPVFLPHAQLILTGPDATRASQIPAFDANPERADRTLRFRGLLRDRTYTLCVSPVDGLSLIREGVRSDAGELTVRLEPGLELTGRVLVPDGATDVRVGFNDGRISANAVVEADGRFTFTGLPAGSYDVTAWIVVGGKRNSGRAEIRAGESGDIDLRRK